MDELQERVEQLQAKSARVASFPDWMVMVALAFGGVAVAHLVADLASVEFTAWLDNTLAANPDSMAIYLSSITKGSRGVDDGPARVSHIEKFLRRITYHAVTRAKWGWICGT